ncbi:propanediol utilization protein [Pseudothioclava arenosa]|uniref:Propanediol utilization protein n=1 Tax=Pseudothioclava arenosa TaxID=1795308 RepID=A0A2A4CNR7_9RHOB|nr:propanediol utilization protein [Pseudothioclava arenosa]PCD76881.1 propanediol utilization protein [Pseudothioclava arenosa]
MTVLARAAGHFGEWLQGRLGPDGPVALVTLACPVLEARVLDEAPDNLNIAAQHNVKKVISEFLDNLGLTAPAAFSFDLDMPLGAGAGASTAALVALARAAGFSGPPETLAKACLRAEGATDPLMFPRPDALLWASREARVLETLPPPPACEIVGGYWGDHIKTDPQDAVFSDISDILNDWRDACFAQDLATVAQLASTSAERCTRLRGPEDPMAELARTLGALGHVRAHTGSARGLIFSPGNIPPNAVSVLNNSGLRVVFSFRTGITT